MVASGVAIKNDQATRAFPLAAGGQGKGAGRLVVFDRYTACHHGGVQPAFGEVLLIVLRFWAKTEASTSCLLRQSISKYLIACVFS